MNLENYSLEKFTPTSFSVGNLHRKLCHLRKFFAQKVLHRSILPLENLLIENVLAEEFFA
jgi:hypothetical protein